jgi:Na+/melibiose symporter-like transporter
MVGLGLASGALSALFAGAGTVLLAQQVENIDRPHKVAVLGVIAGVSAAFALVFNPIGGALSDRTRSRLGRRSPWLLGAPAALLIVLAWLGHSRTVPVILAAWCLAQSVVNLYQAPLTAVIPDRVAPARRGAASAVTGVASVVGGVAGVGLASLFTSDVSRGYLTLGVLLAVTAVTFVLTTGEPSSAHLPVPQRDTRSLPARIAAFLSALTHRDFACVFASRPAVAGAGCVLPVLSPTFTAVEIYAAFAGLAFGTYLSVDAALVTLVLPRSEDAARDLGVLNIANAGPQVLAPLFAALIIGHLGGYRVLFIIGGCCGVAGAIAVLPVRSVR